LKLSSNSVPSGSEGSTLQSIQFLTLFPELIQPLLGVSLLGKAVQRGLIHFGITAIRDFATDRHRTVDDTPYGGGEGMLLRVDVLHAAWTSIVAQSPEKKRNTLLLSPQGPLLTQAKAQEYLQEEELILVCGHYEGVDERFIELCVDEEVSIGDYVLTGGEIPALVLADVVTRLVPGVVGNPDSISGDSLEAGLLKYPQYTRPRVYEGQEVPEVLLGGNHPEIARWRHDQRLERTRLKRPDLWRALEHSHFPGKSPLKK
jgi:tRNA (guanine37-N1)-methyltransferase